MQDHLNPPYGGTLVNLLAPPERASDLQGESRDWPSWDLTARQLCDLELLAKRRFLSIAGLYVTH